MAGVFSDLGGAGAVSQPQMRSTIFVENEKPPFKSNWSRPTTRNKPDIDRYRAPVVRTGESIHNRRDQFRRRARRLKRRRSEEPHLLVTGSVRPGLNQRQCCPIPQLHLGTPIPSPTARVGEIVKSLGLAY